MHIGIPKEYIANETRVAVIPKIVKQLIKMGFTVSVETGAGILADFKDIDFIAAGAIITTTYAVWRLDIILKVNVPTKDEIALLKKGATLISFIWPAQNIDLLKSLCVKNITVIAMDAVPRISRAQSLDALSSMSSIAGYRAVIEASHKFKRFFAGQITAAGKVTPAKVMVIGAGVAGLSAIGTAIRLGALVKAFDIRPEAKEQVQSMGAEFLDLNIKKEKIEDHSNYSSIISKDFIEAEIKLFTEQVREVDIIITTVLIPGKDKAPRLITNNMLASMKPGSVIVDLAAKFGGNCDSTVADTISVTDNNIYIIGYTDLPCRLATQSSQLYATNIFNLLKILCKGKDGNILIDFDDVVIRNMTVIRNGELTWPAPLIKDVFQSKLAVKDIVLQNKKNNRLISPVFKYSFILLILILFCWIVNFAPSDFLSHFTIFILSCVVGYYIIWNVSYALHTPLMSVTNAISGIIVVGALLQISNGGWISCLSFIAILISSINIFGGFTVTQRMLKMFRKD